MAIVHKEDSVHAHTAKLDIFTRRGAKIELEATINLENKLSRYIKSIHVTRGIGVPASLTFTLTSILPSDTIIQDAIKIERIPSETNPTWKTVLKAGSKVDVTINGEYRGTFIVNGVRRNKNPTMRLYTVRAMGLQEWIRRQTLFFDFGNERVENFDIFKKIIKIDPKIVSDTIPGAIRIIVQRFLFDALNSGDYKFSDGSSINEVLDFALSENGYLGRNLVFMQNFSPMSDYNMWENLMKYQSPPYHEIWVTNGDRALSLANGETLYLREKKEYLVFRPVPYDDEILFGQPIPDSVRAIIPGGVSLIELHNVKNNFSHQITDFHVKESDLGTDDADAYSMYSVLLSGFGMDANSSSMLYPPLVDLEAFQYLGKKVLPSRVDAIDVSGKVKEDPIISSFTELAQNMQLKSYHWFKNGPDFNVGTIKTVWLNKLYEGEHLDYVSKNDPEDSAVYYINSYDLIYDVESFTVEYKLNVTRGTPKEGFVKKFEPDVAELGGVEA